ncbi:hypothetical protein BDV95DRAFT_603503 [Massariosphaeria phaeospora]|uniref:Uncharacterized protein n=1 Tax=Massariosphaeria phaeospora TaxID=100035 RepID=A0A7C8MGD9_9PLEO|nr:hypothetical protein BDV95DRAFT_603503 [Massariosphaeria phaeospora]
MSTIATDQFHAQPAQMYVTPRPHLNQMDAGIRPMSRPFPADIGHKNSYRPDSNIVDEDEMLRNELFGHLLNRLNGFEVLGAAHLEYLVDNLWTIDSAHLETTFGDRLPRMSSAIEAWVALNVRLEKFQRATQYYGPPGREWKAHLQGMGNGAARAKACVELPNLRAWWADEDYMRALRNINVDRDLAEVFNALTRFKGGNGAEELAAAGAYTRRMLEWVS